MNPKEYAAFIALAVAHVAGGGNLDQWARKHGKLSKAEIRIVRDRARGTSNHRRRAA